ncbi:F-box/kelch-repeat protein SKIP25-like [Andrographis paniculata]|uniref:F-box/kelch-repeat protein SKIP25-like n=1 Tax=Andrographis paniculata TaxID=175694 RepID=UPI0021E83251|nr:F-box/kelch-repeat protein SKIP25-like [Andrographis paniculata]
MSNSTAIALYTGSAATTATAAADSKYRTLKRCQCIHPDCHGLLPGLPEEIAQLCLSLVPASTLFAVCHSWRRLIYSPEFPPFLSIYALFLPGETLPDLSNSIQFSSFDPISHKWEPLPNPPSDPPLCLLYRHPSFISRKLPIQSVTVSGNLVLLAATADQFIPALSRPLIFNSLLQKWTYGPDFSAPRRWCAAGASGGALYIASGIGSQYDNDVARSVEKWNPNNNTAQSHHRKWRWEKKARLRDAKFSREAIEAVGWKGKLCMVNVKGDAAKEGAIYDVERDVWEDMPEGMLAGWRGPAAAMEEDTIYVVDESRGSLKKYDHVRDTWVEVLENEILKGAQQAAAGGGRLCVLCADGVHIAVVDVAAEDPPARLWTVESPPGVQAVGIHILPRLSRPKF